MSENQVIRFLKRPDPELSMDLFGLEDAPMPDPAAGEMVIETIYHSLDPYMRPRMTNLDSYIPAFEVGGLMEGGGIGRVVSSNGGAHGQGTILFGMMPWAKFYATDGEGLMPVDPSQAPLPKIMGILGGTALTGWVGVRKILEPKEGETLFVSAAAGAVGSFVAQMGKQLGCKVVGSAGSDDKVAWLMDEVGIDGAFNYKKMSYAEGLDKFLPEGIDCNFENVGGDCLQACLDRMNHYGRIAFCGAISQYNDAQDGSGPGLQNAFRIISHKIKMEGFIVSDHLDDMPAFQAEIAPWAASGKLVGKETIYEGFENMPQAFLDLFEGQNFGKMLVKVAEDPSAG